MTGRFSKTEGREFRDRCRAAIEGQTLSQELFDAWVETHDRRRLNIKKGTISSTRARILNAEATSYAALLAALPQQCRIEAKVAETSGDVKELLVQSTATLDMTTDIKSDTGAIRAKQEEESKLIQGLADQLETDRETMNKFERVNTGAALPDRLPDQTARERLAIVYGEIRRLQSEGKNLRAGGCS